VGWESSTDVMCGVVWEGLAPHGAGASDGPLLPLDCKRGLGKKLPGTSSSDELRPTNVHALRLWLAVGWAKSLVKSLFLEELLCHWCFLTNFPLSLRTFHPHEHR